MLIVEMATFKFFASFYETILTIMSHYYYCLEIMFYLLLALVYEEYNSGRMDFETYQENIILLAKDYESLRSAMNANTQAA